MQEEDDQFDQDVDESVMKALSEEQNAEDSQVADADANEDEGEDVEMDPLP